MATVAVFIFSVFTHLLLLYSAESCPPSLFCNERVGNISFPFKNTTQSPPECGLFTVNCSDSLNPKIQIKGGGYWFQLESIYRSDSFDSVFINDGRLQERIERLKGDTCDDDVFNDLSLPRHTILKKNSLTLFKCKNTQEKSPHNYACMSVNHIYYTVSNDSFLFGLISNDSFECPPIQIPIHPHSRPNVYSPSALTATFSLRVPFTEECDPDEEGKCAKAEGHLRLKLGLGCGVVGVVVLVLVILCCSRRKLSSSRSIFFWKKQNQSRRNMEAFLSNYGPLQVKRYSYLDVKKMTNSFEEKLGQGGYGSVYKGKLKSGPMVAVKILNRSKGNGEDFMNEVAAISRTSHVNIVSLLGFCFEASKRALVYEFMPNGSLDKFIFDANNPRKDHHLGWEALEQISLGIARGLEYLHRGCNTRILHFDVKPHNILLDENFSPKISDFGLAKICDRKESIVSMLCARGTAGYIAPEVFCRNFGGVSHKSDVYSYGMMLSEMVGGRRNINVEAEDTSEIYFPH